MSFLPLLGEAAASVAESEAAGAATTAVEEGAGAETRSLLEQHLESDVRQGSEQDALQSAERDLARGAEREIQNVVGHIEVVELGPERLSGVAERLARPEPAMPAVMREMEAGERTIFQGYGGKYVRTGATRASLTESGAAGAIRELMPGGFSFGTSIWWAKFQGTSGPGRHRPPSAILRATEKEAEEASRTILAYVMHGGTP